MDPEDNMELKHMDIKIQDVMSTNPIIIRKNDKVRKAAQLMKDAHVGSLVVLDEKGEMEGIVTESDIVFDTVAHGLNPEETTVENIMSTPVHTIESSDTIEDCAKKMAKLNVRRLPVVKKGEMVGVITENDIISISPMLLEITREYARISYPEDIEEYKEPPKKEIAGYCESCDVYSDRLINYNGQLLCPECR
ncbi:MAG: cyclic nucleotide-binding/CBS domain-containing protein [Thermoplasmatota archaeon]